MLTPLHAYPITLFELNWPHKLLQNGTIRMYGFTGVGVALLKEACHCGGRL